MGVLTNSVLRQIYPIIAFGFELSGGDFYKMYEVCFDPDTGNTR
jgi:hypothetical protein